MNESRPLTKREERRFERQAVKRYHHGVIRFRPCWSLSGPWGFVTRPCAYCSLRWLVRDFERERRRFVREARAMSAHLTPIKYRRNAAGKWEREATK